MPEVGAVLLILLCLCLAGLVALCAWLILSAKTAWQLGLALCVVGLLFAWPIVFAGVLLIAADAFRPTGNPPPPSGNNPTERFFQ